RPLPRRLALRRGAARGGVRAGGDGAVRAGARRRAPAAVARPGVPEAAAPPRRRAVAPGLLVLDADGTRAPRDAERHARRRRRGERLPVLRAGQPPLRAPAAPAVRRAARRGPRAPVAAAAGGVPAGGGAGARRPRHA